MTVRLYGHPFSSYTWKALIALHERAVAFNFLMVDPDHPENLAAVARHAPTGQFPVLVDDGVDSGRVIIESAAIIDYLDCHHGDAPPMVPADPRAAIEARQMDGVFDDYVMTPLVRMVSNVLRPPEKRDPHLDAEMEGALTKAYTWLDRWMTGRTWGANEIFGIADCAAAPALFYAHWGYPIAVKHVALRQYRARLMARPSVARVIDEARPWRNFFPLKERGSPD